jgi:hypothetical protein
VGWGGVGGSQKEEEEEENPDRHKMTQPQQKSKKGTAIFALIAAT